MDAPQIVFSRFYRKRVIILLDEYDTPMQEAYINGYWDDLMQFMRSLFNSTFKTNLYLELDLTNFEVKLMFHIMIKGWFLKNASDYNDFIKALLMGDLDAMNDYMNGVAQSVFSYFDTGKNPSREEPERFYHGFVLGLMVELQDRYVVTSNRESGFGRYDVMLEPLHDENDAMILEFKVFQPRREKSLADTLKAALKQINDRNYETLFMAKGISKERIRKYGFVFSGKEILIGSDN